MNKGMKPIISGEGLMLRPKKFHGCFTLLKWTMSAQFSISPVKPRKEISKLHKSTVHLNPALLELTRTQDEV